MADDYSGLEGFSGAGSFEIVGGPPRKKSPSSGGVAPTIITDPFFSNVVLLMGYEGSDGSTGAPGMNDESPSARGTATVFGNAQIDTAQFAFGTSALLLDGTGDAIEYNDSADFNLGAGLFTIECRIRPNSVAGIHFIVGQWNTAGNLGWILSTVNAAVNWNVSTDGTNNLTDLAGGTLTTLTWFVVCVDYDGTKYRLYVDGVMVASSSTARTIFNSPNHLSIGSNDPVSTFFYNGHFDEMRITKGVARYASDSGYTPATTRFPRS